VVPSIKTEGLFMAVFSVEDRIAFARASGRLIVSPSQLDFYKDCKRKWAWRYIARIPTAPNQWAALGSAVHRVLEDWLRDGTPPDRNTEVGAIALSGIKHLPDPGTVQVEGRFLWEFPDEPFDVQGVIDWSQITEALFGDHKTTGDFKWAKTPEDLRADLQSTIYAAYLIETHNLAAITGRWVYYRTKGRRASKCVEWQITRAELQEPLENMRTMAREMAHLMAERPDPRSLEFNAEACDHYGGCAFRDNCDLTSQERFKALMSHMSLKEKMRQKRAERSGTVTPPPVAGSQAITPPSTPPPGEATPAPAAVPPAVRSVGETAVDRARALREKMAAQIAKRSTPEPVESKQCQADPVSPPAPEPKPPATGLKAKMAAKAEAAKAKAMAVADDPPDLSPAPSQVPAPVSASGAGAMTLKEKMAATLAARAAAEPPPGEYAPPPPMVPPSIVDPVVPEEGQVAINPPEDPPPPPPPEPEAKAKSKPKKKGKVVIKKKAKAKPAPELEAVPPPEQEPVISDPMAPELPAVIEARPPIPRPPEPPRPPVPYRDPAEGPSPKGMPDPLPTHTDEKGQEHTKTRATDPGSPLEGPPLDMPPPPIPKQHIEAMEEFTPVELEVLARGVEIPSAQELAALYVDCAPLKTDGAVVPVSRILQEVPKGQTLAQALGKTVHLQGCSVTMSMRTPGALEIYDTLSALAKTVIRGF
jgi:hypothetical protein